METNLSQVRLSHWSFGLRVGDDDPDPRQDLLRGNDADESERKLTVTFEKNKQTNKQTFPDSMSGRLCGDPLSTSLTLQSRQEANISV